MILIVLGLLLGWFSIFPEIFSSVFQRSFRERSKKNAFEKYHAQIGQNQK